MNHETTTFLGGYRVLDLTDEKGHFCGKLLGDLGADVIKIEPPGGDSGRNRGPFYKDIPDPEKSLQWFFTGLNKRGITLNLETTDGRELFKRLAKTADFVIESFEPGYMARLGLGYEELEKIKPSIIMTSITPFGQSGPYVHYKATDLVGVSMGGLARLFGELDGPPTRISAPQFYFLGSIQGAVGSMVAHYHRELTEDGQHVDVSCQQAVLLALRIAAETWDLIKVNPKGMGPNTLLPRPTPPGPVYVPIIKPCKDGHVVSALLGGAQAGFVKSSRALVAFANQEGMALELKDFEWENMDSSTVTQEEVTDRNELLGPFLLSKAKAELFDEALKQEILLIPVNTAEDIAESPQLRAREFWRQVEHPELDDTIVYPGWPVKWTEMPAYSPQRRAPLIGEHNREVYEGELGLSPAQLVLLKTQGVI
jgi:crotonobetainyl-CoA:carnitine CoA-transferase CaiB-like acyl-CoA transferase